jgi:flagellar motor protein MotB
VPVSKKPIRLPRIERDEEQTVHEDENAHLWAISYADFLMAILSFFILFYSADDPKRKALIMNLSQDFSSRGAPGSDGAQSSPANHTEGAGRIPAGFAQSLSSLDISSEKQNDTLILNFSDNFFPPGRYEISKDKVAEVNTVLSKIKPFENQVNLYFEGHADDQAFKPNQRTLLKDNFILSSLRASSALFLAKQLGFSEKNLFIQAASSNLRNSRSLSIRIEPREAKL